MLTLFGQTGSPFSSLAAFSVGSPVKFVKVHSRVNSQCSAKAKQAIVSTRSREDEIAGEVRQLRRQSDAEVIDERLDAGDDGDEDDLVGKPSRNVVSTLIAEPGRDGAGEEAPGADIDGAEHGDEAEQVEPGREPPGEAVAEDRTPVIQAARCRIGRGDLPHGEGEHARDQAADRPADADRGAAGARRRLSERIDAAGKNADDRKRDREIRERAHSPLEFLGVAHRMEDLHILLPFGFRIFVFKQIAHVPAPFVRLDVRLIR